MTKIKIGDNGAIKEIYNGKYSFDNMHFYTFIIDKDDLNTIIVQKDLMEYLHIDNAEQEDNKFYYSCRKEYLQEVMSLFNEEEIKTQLYNIQNNQINGYNHITYIRDLQEGDTKAYLCYLYGKSDSSIGGILHSLKENTFDSVTQKYQTDKRKIGIFNIIEDSSIPHFWANDYAASVFGVVPNDKMVYDLKPSYEAIASHMGKDNFIEYMNAVQGDNAKSIADFEYIDNTGDNKHYMIETVRKDIAQNGNVNTITCIVRDISYNADRTAELEHLCQMFETQGYSKNVGIWYIDVKENPDKIWASDRTAYMCGFEISDDKIYSYNNWISAVQKANGGDADSIGYDRKEMFVSVEPGYEKEYMLISIDGTKRWVSDKFLKIIRDEKGAVTEIFGILIDITNQVNRTEKLHELNTIFDKTLKSGKVGAWVAYFDNESAKFWAADNTMDMLNLPCNKEKTYNLEILQQLINKAEGILSDSSNDPLGVNKSIFLAQNKKGQERWYTIKSDYTDYDADGNAIKSYGVVSDIDSLVKQGNALEELTNMFNETTSSGFIGTWMIDFTDMKNKTFWCNDIVLEMTGITPTEDNTYLVKDVFRNISKSMDKKLMKTALSAFSDAMMGKEDYVDTRLKLTNRMGGNRWYQAKSRSIQLDESGRLHKMYGVLIDINDDYIREKRIAFLTSMFKESAQSGNVGLWAVDEYEYPGQIFMSDYTASMFVDTISENSMYPRMVFYKYLSASMSEDEYTVLDNAIKMAVNGEKDSIDEKIKLTVSDGTAKWFALKSNTLQRDSDNIAMKLYGVIIDIDENMKYQEELQRMSYMLEHTMESAGVGSFVIDKARHDGYLWLADNTANILGAEKCKTMMYPNKVLENNVYNSNEAEYSKYLKTKLDNILSGECDYFDEHLLLTDVNNTTRWYECRSCNVDYFDDGRAQRIYGVFIDIDERVKSGIKLQKISKLQKILIDISAKYIDIDMASVNDGIVDILSMLGGCIDADRVNIFKYEKKYDLLSTEYTWNADDSDLYDTEQCIHKIKEYYLSNTDEDKANVILRTKIKRNYYNTENTHISDNVYENLIVTPIIINSSIYGFISYENYCCENDLSEEELDLLKLFTSIYTNIVQRTSAENDRNESEEKYRNLFEASLNSVQIIDIKSQVIIDCNNNTVKMVGAESKDDIIGSEIANYTPTYQNSGILSSTYVENSIEKALLMGEFEFNLNLVKLDGELFDGHVKLSAVSFGGEQFVRSSLNDITEQSRQQEIIKKSQRHLQITTESASIAPWEWNIDLDRTYSTEIYTKVTGIELDKAGTKTWKKNIHPDDLEMVERNEKQLFDGIVKSYTITYRFFHKVKDNYVWIKDTAVVDTRDMNNYPITVIGISQDITAQKDAEEEVRLNEERLRIAMDSAKITTWEWNVRTNYGFISGNNNEFWNISSSEGGFSKFLYDRIHPDDLSMVEDAINAVVLGETDVAQLEQRFRRDIDSEYKWILTAGKIVERDDKDMPVLISGIVLDIDERKRIDKDIRAAEKDLANVFNSATNGFIIIDATNNNIVNVNPMTIKMFGGMNESDFIYYKLNDFTPKYQEDERLSEDAINHAMEKAKEESIYCDEMIFRKFDDTKFNCEVEYTNTIYRNSPAFIISIKDITDRKEYEKRTDIFYNTVGYEIEDMNEFTLYVLESALYLTDSGAAALVEYDEKTDEYFVASAVWTDNNSINSAYYDKPCQKLDYNILYNKDVVMDNNANLDFDLGLFVDESFSGQQYHIDRALGVPIVTNGMLDRIVYVVNSQTDYNENNAVHLGILMDSAWKKVELYNSSKRILAAKEAAETIIETVPIPLQVFDSDINKVYITNKAYIDYMGQENDEQTVILKSFVNEEDEKKIVKMLHESGGAESVEVHIRKSGTGEMSWALLTFRKIFYMNKNSYIVGVFDLSEIKKAQAQQEAARQEAIKTSKIKSEFLANMSHEIRTPINAVIGLNDLMQKTQLSAKQLDYTNKLGESAKNLLSIINDVLDVSRLESGKFKMERIEFNLDDVLDNVFTIVSFRVQKKNIQFFVNKDNSIPDRLMGDPYRLEQVLLNLTDNAVKFTEKGEVIVSADLIDNGDNALVKFTVKDTGIGMTESQVGDLFAAFHQADSSTTRKFGGTGLGLNISQKIVSIMGGKITVKSEYNKGSEFTFTLKFDNAKSISQDSDNIFDDIKLSTVLVVDSNTTSQIILKNYFANLIQDSVYVDDIEEAIEEYLSEAFDIVLVDCSNGDCCGQEAIKTIKALDEYDKKTKFIIMNAEMSAVDDIAECDADYVIPRPFNKKAVIDAITTICIGEQYEDKEVKKNDEEDVKLDCIRGANILLVEDHEINQQIVREMLEMEGFYVDVADDGSIALIMLERTEYDLILMDLQMPKVDGYVASRVIREDLELDTPIVAVSADVMTGVLDKVKNAGMNDYVSKPIDRKQLFEVMLKWIEPKGRKVNTVEAKEEIMMTREMLADILKDINVEGGMYRVPENYAIYSTILSKFMAGNTEYFTKLDDIIKNGDIDAAKRDIHSFKGVVGMIGAMQLYEKVVEIEKKLKSKELDGIYDMTTDAAVDLSRIMEQINKLTTVISDTDELEEGKEDIDINKLKEKINELYVLLDIGNTNAEDNCNEILKYRIQPDIYNRLTRIKVLIGDYDFAEASELCMKIKRSLE